MQENNIDNHV